MRRFAALILILWLPAAYGADSPEPEPVAGQPLAANIARLLRALDFLGAPLSAETNAKLQPALRDRDADAIQRTLDPHVLCVVELNPEVRVKARRGPADAILQQSGYTPMILKIINHSTVTHALNVTSPQAGQVYAGVSGLSAQRMQRLPLREYLPRGSDTNRFLDIELFAQPPMTPNLSGLQVEYAIALICSRDAGKLEATLEFDVGQGTQDLGFRAEVPMLFTVRPAFALTLKLRDHDGSPAMARLIFRDAAGHVFPPQAKRLAPDLFFQEQIYRRDGEQVRLPPGRFTVEFSRGPEYRVLRREIEVRPGEGQIIEARLERWIHPSEFGFFSGDHHIHGAGCAHYTSPTEGVMPEDMFRQVAGEGLNVGCVLTWGPCFDHQRRYFSPGINELSTPFTVMKYDLEISGFGSEALGHVCLLNLRDQVYPGSDGTKTKGWPKWTTPVLRWAKQQGAVTGYAHSGDGLGIVSTAAAKRLLTRFDTNNDGLLTSAELDSALLPEPFAQSDTDRDGVLTESELVGGHDRAANRLPNLAIPEMGGVGAMEIPVSTALGVCDFISAMDTPRIAEWNMWYHLLNCGFPLKVSGETDFPCMSGSRVGQGRVYVQLGRIERLDFTAWCEGLRRGRSYVSDGFAHALEFTVNGTAPGFGEINLSAPGPVRVKTKVAFAPTQPLAVAHGGIVPPGGARWVGDTVEFRGPRPTNSVSGGGRKIEVVVNGSPVATKEIEADGQIHEVEFEVQIGRSSWIALRHFPQMHTNPVNVLVGGRPIRAARSSALWLIETIQQLWRVREKSIPETERAEAKQAFDQALDIYHRIAAEAPE